MLLVSTKLVQDELLLDSPKTKSFKNNSNQNNNNVKLLLVMRSKRPKIKAANTKLANNKLLLILTKLNLKIGQDIKAKKVIILKTG